MARLRGALALLSLTTSPLQAFQQNGASSVGSKKLVRKAADQPNEASWKEVSSALQRRIDELNINRSEIVRFAEEGEQAEASSNELESRLLELGLDPTLERKAAVERVFESSAVVVDAAELKRRYYEVCDGTYGEDGVFYRDQ